jgi:hypothetical protein
MEDTESSQVTINFTSQPSSEEYDAVQRSIQTLRQRADHLNSVRRATDEALGAVLPLPPERKRVEIADDDPAAVAAMEAVEREQREFLAAMTLDPSRLTSGEGAPFAPSAADAGVASEVFAIPYHYDWRWHVGQLAAENIADRPTGQIRVSVVGHRRCDAHAGFGVGVRSDHDHWATARSLRRSWEKCRVWSGATGAVSLAEGGMEMTLPHPAQPRVLERSGTRRVRQRGFRHRRPDRSALVHEGRPHLPGQRRRLGPGRVDRWTPRRRRHR